MSKSIVTNYVDTTVSGTAPVWTLPKINFSEDFRVKIDDPDHVEITNLTSPLGAKEDMIFKTQVINNVYRNSGIDNSMQSAKKQGCSLLSQINEVWTIKDSDPSVPDYQLPVSAHIVLRFPSDPNITEDSLLELMKRADATLYDTGSNTTARFKSMLRRALMPKGL